VALKLGVSHGDEAQTLARLSHPNIVQVYSESVENGQRLLCIQYVAGPTLGHVIHHVAAQGCATGEAVLQEIDAQLSSTVPFVPARLPERQRYEGLDACETACHLGEQLAEALGYAH